jgi:c-di-GMP-binding flagellar brake protein YcgR
MQFKELQTGTRLELELINSLGEKIAGPYVSQLLEPVSETRMIISTPIFESRLIFIPLNGKLHISFFHRKYGLMGFTAVVAARESRGNVATLKIQAQSGLERVQRRKHYRLDSLLNSEYRIFGASPDKSSASSLTKATVKNISGSGACIMTEENVPKNTVIELYIRLNEKTKIKAVCTVLRNQPVEVKKGVSYELGLHFTEISPKDQDIIIKYIFEQQRMLLKKDVLDK